MSAYFSINSGVPEGSLLGPRLYNIVMDKLLFLLQNSGLGCHIENLFAGAIAYADDLIILSASVRHQQLILDLCVDFGQEYDIVFNCDKSQCGTVNKPICKLAQMILDNKILKWSDNFIYLGIDFVLGSSLNVCCKNRIRKFYGFCFFGVTF